MLLLLPVGGINEGGEPIEGAKWNFGNHELELLIYQPDKAEISQEALNRGGKFIILERRVRGVVLMRCKVGVYDFQNPIPNTIFIDYTTGMVEVIGAWITANYLHGVPTLEWAMAMGKTFLTDYQEENYFDWEIAQGMISGEMYDEDDVFHTFNHSIPPTTELDTTIWKIDEKDEEDDEDTDDAG